MSASGLNPRLSLLSKASRKAVGLSEQGLIRSELLVPGTTLPLLVQPAVEGLNLAAWAESNRGFIETSLSSNGGMLFRGFHVAGVADFEKFISNLSGTLLEYKDPTSPRSKVSGNIYTSTDYPPEHRIPLHNENSYSHTWPLKLFFFCVVAPREGGETPIADVRKVFQRISPETRAMFIEKQVMYVRNFGDGFGLSWQSVFGTEDKRAVEENCREQGIEFEWKDGGRLRTRQVRRAVARHPRTGEMVWFNHGAFFHVSTLEPSIRDVLLSEFSYDDLPYNTFYGDGSAIESEVLDEIRDAYAQETVVFPWQAGDVLLLDNMLAAHARMSYSGPRKIVVGMSEPFDESDLEQVSRGQER